MNDTSDSETDIADRCVVETLIGLIAEQGNLFAYLAQLAAVCVEPEEEYRLAEHDAKERYGRTLLGKGAAQIDSKIEKLRTILQRTTRFSVYALDPRTGHMGINQRQPKCIDHLTLDIPLEAMIDLPKKPTHLLLNFVSSGTSNPSMPAKDLRKLFVQPMTETKSR